MLSEACLADVADFVDALSAPIQFLSQAEKRAKQLEGLGIDEKDISDVSVAVRRKQEPATTLHDSAQSSTASTTTANNQTAVQSTGASTALQPTASDKEKKSESLYAQLESRENFFVCVMLNYTVSQKTCKHFLQ